MKKFLSVLCIIVVIASLSVAFMGCKGTPRENVLKIFLPGEYIDEEIFEEFESWYLEETGKTVEVKIETFEVVEDISRSVEKGKADFDLVCPSDYMVEYLIRKNLLKKVNKEIIDVEAEGLFRPEYLTVAREYDPNLEYSVPYMYGTLGIAYDKSKTHADITSWTDLFGTTYAGSVSIKKSVRDAYAAACLYNARNTLSGLSGNAQKTAVQAVFDDFTQSSMDAAQTLLINTSKVWDGDNVKYEMAAGSSDVKVALMWSCDAGYVMNEYEDEDGEIHQGYKSLWYVVPDEGGNIYMDNFCISKYAVNEQAANYFLKFLCTKDAAVANSKYAGAISPVAEAYKALYKEYSENTEMYEGTEAGWKEMFLETMFPSAATLNRCGVMKDAKEREEYLGYMWSEVVAS